MFGYLRLVALILTAATAACSAAIEAGEVVTTGNTKELRDRDDDEPQSSPDHPPLLILAVDGMNRDLLYEMLRKRELPELAKLLAGTPDGQFPHTHFDESMLSTLPSSTIPAWVTLLTGQPPSVHGVTGNEFFIREKGRFAAPVPVTFSDPTPVFQNFTDGYLNDLVLVPSVYNQLRKHEPHLSVWVAMHHYHAGADKLLVTNRDLFVKAFESFVRHQVKKHLTGKEPRNVYETLDEAVIGAVLEELDEDDVAVPDVLTVYISGTDQFAHVAADGPDPARREYLRDLDNRFATLREGLQRRNALANRYVLLVSDHGHTRVVPDRKHSLGMDDADDPPALVKKAGYRLREFKHEVAGDADHQAVLAYQGAMAYVYVADRSTCEKPKTPCDWRKPPRFREDVLPLAKAFLDSSRDGTHVKALKGTLDLVLTRKPRPHAEVDLPYEVFTGDEKLVPIADYLAKHAHPDYVALDERLRDLAAGPAGERAGDILLIANNGNRATPGERFYFSSEYSSWHGSPSKQDSEIPLIVAHPGKTAAELGQITRESIGDKPVQQRFTDLVLRLRLGRAASAASKPKAAVRR